MSGEGTGYESRVGRAIDVPPGWVGLPRDKDPRTSDAFVAIVPGTYVVNRVESVDGQPWVTIVAGSLGYRLDAFDALGPPDKPPPGPVTADPEADLERLKRVNFPLYMPLRLMRGIPWDLDPAQAKEEDWVRVPPGSYRVDRVEMRGGERWVWLYQSPAHTKYEKTLPSLKLPARPGEFG